MKNIINSLINAGKLVADKPIVVTDKKIQIFKTSTDRKIYVYNPATKRACSYVVEDGVVGGYKPISIDVYNTQVSLLKKRLAEIAEEQRKQAERAAKAAATAIAVDNSNINAPATKNAVRLDAEREDSKFDGRRQDEIFGSMTEAEAYEVFEDLDDEGEDAPVITRGHHKAVLVSSESIKAMKKTNRNGESYISKAYISFTFSVDGKEFTSRAYAADYDSFKRQANHKHHGIFNYTPAKEAREALAGETFDIWVKWNDVLGELQAEFYDKAAYAARKAEQAKVGTSSIRSGYNRVTENKATR